jgi:2-keto-3-deoxy-L-rhamnonate aldolase RhmA
MNGRELREALHDGRRVYGTLVVSPSPHALDAAAACGLDFIFIDTEHVPLDRLLLSWMCRAYDGIGLAPVVRITRPDPYEACTVLDGGAMGVIAPYVESAEQVRALVGAVKYRPLKGEKLAAFLNGETLEPELQAYLEQRNTSRSLIVNIESVPAIEALDEILAVPGLDAVLVGPHDLTCSLGVPEQYDHPDFQAAVDGIIAKARAQSVGAGTHAIYPQAVEHELRWAKLGANLILHRADVLGFVQTISGDIRRLREELGDTGAGSGVEVAI